MKCEMKPCLVKKGIRHTGAILLVEQRFGGEMKANHSLPTRMNLTDVTFHEARKDCASKTPLVSGSHQADKIGFLWGALAPCLHIGNGKDREKTLSCLLSSSAWLCFRK